MVPFAKERLPVVQPYLQHQRFLESIFQDVCLQVIDDLVAVSPFRSFPAIILLELVKPLDGDLFYHPCIRMIAPWLLGRCGRHSRIHLPYVRTRRNRCLLRRPLGGRSGWLLDNNHRWE